MPNQALGLAKHYAMIGEFRNVRELTAIEFADRDRAICLCDGGEGGCAVVMFGVWEEAGRLHQGNSRVQSIMYKAFETVAEAEELYLNVLLAQGFLAFGREERISVSSRFRMTRKSCDYDGANVWISR